MGCLATYAQGGSSYRCPNCKNRCDSVVESKYLTRILQSQPVTCPNAEPNPEEATTPPKAGREYFKMCCAALENDNGDHKEDEKEDLDSILDSVLNSLVAGEDVAPPLEVPRQNVRKPNPPKLCDWCGTLSGLSKHLQNCKHNPLVQCTLCKHSVPNGTLPKHKSESCSETVIQCSEKICGASCKRKDMAKHIKDFHPHGLQGQIFLRPHRGGSTQTYTCGYSAGQPVTALAKELESKSGLIKNVWFRTSTGKSFAADSKLTLSELGIHPYSTLYFYVAATTQSSPPADPNLSLRQGKCAICRNSLHEPSIVYTADPQPHNEEGLQLAFSTCGHCFHLDCTNRWLKTRSLCPSCGKEWEFLNIYPVRTKEQLKQMASRSIN